MPWTFLSNHGRALRALADRPAIRIRELAAELGVTERTAQALVSDLVAAGAVDRVREGRRNRYAIRAGAGLELVGDAAPRPPDGPCRAVVLSCSDYRVLPGLFRLLSREGLVGRAEVVLWPGGGPALAGSDRSHLYDVLTDLGRRRHPERVLLVSHSGCAMPHIPRLAGSDAFAVHRAVRRWARRMISGVERRLGITPELWVIDRGRPGRISAGPPARSRSATIVEEAT